MNIRSVRAWISTVAACGCAAQPAARATASVTPQGATSASVVPIAPPPQDYLALVASESVDQIALVRFGPSGIRVEHTTTTGIMPADVDGPHGVAVSPDGKFFYVSTAHGTPY